MLLRYRATSGARRSGLTSVGRRFFCGHRGRVVSPAGICLSQRQLQVAQLMAEGRGNKAIARELCLSLQTVKNHMTRLHRLLGVASRTEVVVLLAHWGLIDIQRAGERVAERAGVQRALDACS